MFTHSGNRSRTTIGIIHKSAEWNLGRHRPKFHKSANVLAALPKSAHPGAIKAMQAIYNAEDIDHAKVAVKAFKIDYGTKFPKAVEKITSDLDVLLEFYNYPADHWVHLRTTNPIESTFATVRLRSKVTKGPGSRAAGLAMAFSGPAPRSTRANSSNDPPTRRPRSWSPKRS